MIRTLSYVVGADSIMPDGLQNAGRQGDHLSTKIELTIADELYSDLTTQAQSTESELHYRFDAYNAIGNCISLDEQPLTETVEFELPIELTEVGGSLVLYFIVTIVSPESTEAASTQGEVLSLPINLYIENVPNDYDKDAKRESLTTLAVAAKQAAETASDHADEAAASAGNAEAYSQAAASSARAAFGYAGEASDSADESLAYSQAAESSAQAANSAKDAIQNMGVEAEGLSAGEEPTVEKTVDVQTGAVTLTFGIPQGEKGDKGDSVAVDQTFNPSSPNAQSGVAVAGAIAPVTDVIPPQASSQNKLADKDFVNSSIATNTANYISDEGRPFTTLADLKAYRGQVTNNDYAFIAEPSSIDNLLQNGNFDDSSSWEICNDAGQPVQNPPTISEGKLIFDSANTPWANVRQAVAVETGKTYMLSFDIKVFNNTSYQYQSKIQLYLDGAVFSEWGASECQMPGTIVSAYGTKVHVETLITATSDVLKVIFKTKGLASNVSSAAEISTAVLYATEGSIIPINTVYRRYKYSDATDSWVFEYTLNNSSFTAEQWAAINSGITKSTVDGMSAYVKSTDYATADKAGVVKVDGMHGIAFHSGTGLIGTRQATPAELASRINEYNVITPYNLEQAVKTGLGNGTGSKPIATWTATEQSNARALLGAGADIVFIADENTTYAQIKAAYDSGKTVFYHYKEASGSQDYQYHDIILTLGDYAHYNEGSRFVFCGLQNYNGAGALIGISCAVLSDGTRQTKRCTIGTLS